METDNKTKNKWTLVTIGIIRGLAACKYTEETENGEEMKILRPLTTKYKIFVSEAI
jgi:hypothetical protein